MYPKFVQGMGGGEQSWRWWWWTRGLTRRLNKVVKTFKEVEDNEMDGGLESDSPMEVFQWRYWLSAWVTQLQHLNGAKGLHTILQGLPGGGGRGQRHGALLKSVWHTAAWLVLWQNGRVKRLLLWPWHVKMVSSWRHTRWSWKPQVHFQIICL